MIRNKKKTKFERGQVFLHIFFALLSLCYILPLILLISVSFEGHPDQYFRLIPKEFSTEAYRLVLATPKKIIDAYCVTTFYSITGVLLSLFVMVLFAYALSRPNFKLKNILTFLMFFTTLFSGGMVSSYLVNTKLLHLGDNILIYILPGIMNAWNVIVIRTYFQNLSKELFESARLDGASELIICFRIAVPLSTPVLASVGFLRFIDAWNNWITSQIYIKNSRLVSLQYLLKLILDDVEMIKQMIEEGMMHESAATVNQINNLESMRFAMVILGAGPAMMIFPFFQKYFAKGLTIGSVKG